MLPTHPWSIAQEVGANIEHVAPGPLSSGFHGDPMKLLEDNAPHAQPPRCNKRQPASERYELSSSTSVHLCPLKKNMPSRMPRAIQCQSDIGIEKLQRHCKRPVPALDSETSSGPAAPNYGELPGTGKLKESPYKIIKIRCFQKRSKENPIVMVCQVRFPDAWPKSMAPTCSPGGAPQSSWEHNVITWPDTNR